MRIEPNLKRYLLSAAAFDHRTLSQFMVHAALAAAEGLKMKGWRAKDPPVSRDGRLGFKDLAAAERRARERRARERRAERKAKEQAHTEAAA